jgi:hypothetical protein
MRVCCFWITSFLTPGFTFRFTNQTSSQRHA